eukprot:scaffold83946_cov16-Prasinocladus_malaysianus.AAC.1
MLGIGIHFSLFTAGTCFKRLNSPGNIDDGRGPHSPGASKHAGQGFAEQHADERNVRPQPLLSGYRMAWQRVASSTLHAFHTSSGLP